MFCDGGSHKKRFGGLDRVGWTGVAYPVVRRTDGPGCSVRVGAPGRGADGRMVWLTIFQGLKFQVPIRRKSEADLEVEKQESAARHTAQFGKSLGSQPGSEEERHQQALAMLKKKTQAKKDGKRVVADKGVADGAHKQAKRDGKRSAVGDSVTDGANKQAPPKRAKAPRNSSVGALVVEDQQQR
ncbi:hypothetical protein Bca52824_017825 [Brassica carinata]|uniref:Uncharacterized protein n=1 Tax=Brassica carinata TaxID=52824 RepID=A0A8X7VMT0_BRACI|nr:hypothetical protein Bca52824_017825 [Brassica carinata]